jgi:hypothetical protein
VWGEGGGEEGKQGGEGECVWMCRERSTLCSGMTDVRHAEPAMVLLPSCVQHSHGNSLLFVMGATVPASCHSLAVLMDGSHTFAFQTTTAQ